VTYLLPQPLPFLWSRILHRHFGIKRKGTAIPVPESLPVIFNKFVVNVKAIAGGTKEGTDTAAYAF
jgi:hypothetical protein